MTEGVTVADRASERVPDEPTLAALALALGARTIKGWSPAEDRLARASSESIDDDLLSAILAGIEAGTDPLGEALCRLRSRARRRELGATYTPEAIVRAMLAWAPPSPARVVDPGAGSGRYLLAARQIAGAELVGVEVDPLAALIARANLAALGLSHRARIEVADFRSFRLPRIEGATFFVGNPPYVRHHAIAPRWKAWLARSARRAGLPFSGLAGLHAHFFVATQALARPGDAGAYITAAEWLDVGYGKLVRAVLLERLAARELHLLAPELEVFDDAHTTAVLTRFEVGPATRSVSLYRVTRLLDLGQAKSATAISPELLAKERRWGPLFAARPSRSNEEAHIELGEICRVHRGAATGANRTWIASGGELPAHLLVPAVTRARELFSAGPALLDAGPLRQLLDLPADLDALPSEERRAIERFLDRARAAGVHRGYLARHRRPWWALSLREPAPILATYMARRPPAFVRNLCDARHLNIAHGLYPRRPLGAATLDALADHLRAAVSLADGRTYAGGLVKFEPREMERVLVPRALIEQDAVRTSGAVRVPGPGAVRTPGAAPPNPVVRTPGLPERECS